MEDELPVEVWAHVASFLPTKELACGGLALASRRLNEVCSLDLLWSAAYARRWPDSYNRLQKKKKDTGTATDEGTHWKQHFRHQVQIKEAWRQGKFRYSFRKAKADASERLRLAGDKVFTSNSSPSIESIDLNTGLTAYYTTGEEKKPSHLGFDVDIGCNTLISADSSSEKLIAYDVETGQVKETKHKLFEGQSWCTQMDSTKAVLTLGSHVQIWDLQADKLLFELGNLGPSHSQEIRSLKWLDHVLWTGGAVGDCKVKMWDMRGNLKVPIEEATLTSGAWCMDFDGEKLFVGSEAYLYAWDVRFMHTTIAHYIAHEFSHINLVQFDTEKVVTAANDGLIKVWDMSTFKAWHTDLNKDNGAAKGMIRTGELRDNVLVCGGSTADRQIQLFDFNA